MKGCPKRTQLCPCVHRLCAPCYLVEVDRYCIGEAGLFNALYEAGLTMNDVNPDYVVVGETHSYGWEKLERVRACMCHW